MTTTANYTKGQKQALLESLNAQWESGSPMNKAERELLAELTKETLRKNVMTKLNNFATKLSKIFERREEIESEEYIFLAERKELEKLEAEEEKINLDFNHYLKSMEVTQDEFFFSKMRDNFEDYTFDEVKNMYN